MSNLRDRIEHLDLDHDAVRHHQVEELRDYLKDQLCDTARTERTPSWDYTIEWVAECGRTHDHDGRCQSAISPNRVFQIVLAQLRINEMSVTRFTCAQGD